MENVNTPIELTQEQIYSVAAISHINNGNVWARAFFNAGLCKPEYFTDDYYNMAKQITDRKFLERENFWEDFTYCMEDELNSPVMC